MALENAISVHEVGHVLADAVREDPAALDLWIRGDHDRIVIWLLTMPIDRETERRLYGRATLLYERFPRMAIEFRLINPRLFETLDLTTIIPPDAEQFHLR